MLRRKKTSSQSSLSKARKRAQQCTDHELRQWLDVCLSDISRASRQGGEMAYENAQEWSLVLFDITAELRERAATTSR